MLILSYENEISFTCKLNSFSYEWLCARPRFEREALGNSSSILCWKISPMLDFLHTNVDFLHTNLDFPHTNLDLQHTNEVSSSILMRCLPPY